MSFTSEVISSAEEVEVGKIKSQLVGLNLQIELHKHKLAKYLENVYVKYAKLPSNSATLQSNICNSVESCDALAEEVNNLLQNDVIEALHLLNSYKLELESVKLSASLISQIININERYVHFKSLLNGEEFVQVIDEYNYLRNSVNSIEKVHALKKLQDDVVANLEHFKVKMEATLYDNVSFDCVEDMVSVKVGDKKIVRAVLKAFARYRPSIGVLNNFATFLLKHVFGIVLTHKTSVSIGEVEKHNVMCVKKFAQTINGHYEDVFSNLSVILEFLARNLGDNFDETQTILSYVGKLIQEELSELIVNNCLREIVALTPEDMERCKYVVDRVQSLQEKCIECRIFEGNRKNISECTDRIGELYVSKKCEKYRALATNIMKKDLHNTIVLEKSTDRIKSLTNVESSLPQCAISSSCVDLIQLAENMFQDIFSDDVPSTKILYTMKDIFESYERVVQTHHKKFLETLPQQVALFHNNCRYLSDALNSWNRSYRLKFPDVKHPLFETEVYVLKRAGDRAFSSCLRQQIQQIEDILKESGLVAVTSLNAVEPSTEKIIRQCLRHQELLKTVWFKVLPTTDYNKSIGSTLNALCGHLIHAIVKLEDISSEAAESLVEVLRLVQTRGPKLFSDHREVYVHVNNWYMFGELIFVLNGTLADICDRWASGKGPLALQFQPDDVKGLVRALFQNTERRAAVLAKIV